LKYDDDTIILVFYYSELSCSEEDKTLFVTNVNHVTCDEELGSAVLEGQFHGYVFLK
jgi:hypothetical protein